MPHKNGLSVHTGYYNFTTQYMDIVNDINNGNNNYLLSI